MVRMGLDVPIARLSIRFEGLQAKARTARVRGGASGDRQEPPPPPPPGTLSPRFRSLASALSSLSHSLSIPCLLPHFSPSAPRNQAIEIKGV